MIRPWRPPQHQFRQPRLLETTPQRPRPSVGGSMSLPNSSACGPTRRPRRSALWQQRPSFRPSSPPALRLPRPPTRPPRRRPPVTEPSRPCRRICRPRPRRPAEVALC
ncbi:MAG: hypothetical protein EBR88_04370 [Betaproteobacteria bacterium]|nr:hypothetical protein [Betaproteobacteria bacterium]